jgi:hypothetical protein
MVLIQLGSGIHNSIYTFAGCTVGAYLGTEFTPATQCKPNGKRGTYLFSGAAPSIALGLALVGISVAADIFRPWYGRPVLFCRGIGCKQLDLSAVGLQYFVIQLGCAPLLIIYYRYGITSNTEGRRMCSNPL